MVRSRLVVVCALATVGVGGGAAWGEEFLVHSAAEVTAAQAGARPGDVIVMADGVWANQKITLSASGNAAGAITLRAQTPGRVVLTGTSTLTISGDYLVADGLVFKDGTLTGGNIVSFTSSSSHSRWTNSAIVDYDAGGTSGYHWIHVDGAENRVDHNYIKGHVNSGVTLEVNPSIGAKHVIEANQFVDRPVGNGNGFETIRLGVSGIQTRSAQVTVQNNLFERVDGELEIISVKTSNNLIQGNTIRASAGTITLRHGQGSTVAGNFILGENKAGSGGIRVIGPNQTVVNNYMSDLDTNALSITTGYTDWNFPGTATGYEPVDNALIAHNTVVNVSDQIVTRDAGYSSGTNRTARPVNVTMANNLFKGSTETMIQGGEGSGWVWAGNIAYGASSIGKSGSGILNVDPKLVKDEYGVWRPGAGSPAIDAGASGAWGAVTTDMDGQGRVGAVDIGADEVNGVGAVADRPLYGGDVGPGWLNRRTLAPGMAAVPVLVMEAEDFTAVRDPNGNGSTWNVVTASGASGGKILKAPGGGRTDITGPGSVQDAVAEYDVAVSDAGTYYLYGLVRGPGSSANSFYTPANLGDEPTVIESIPDDGEWAWVELASYVVGAGDVNEPLTLKIGRREGNTEIDRLVLSPVLLTTLPVPEPGVGVVILVGVLWGRRGRGSSAEV